MNEQRDTTPILLVHEQNVPQAAIQSISDALTRDNTGFQVEVRDGNRVWASGEWFVPTAVILFLTRSYWDGFLKEAGKDHYGVVKRAAKAAWSRFFGDKPMVRRTLVGSANKVTAPPTYSLTFSIQTVIRDVNVKLLLRNDCTQDGLETAVDAFLAFVTTVLAELEAHGDAAPLQHALRTGHVLLVSYNQTSGRIELLDPRPPSMRSGGSSENS